MRFHHHHSSFHHLHGFHRLRGFRHGTTKGSAIVMLLLLAAALYLFFFVMHGMERLKPAVVPTRHALWTPMRSAPLGNRASHEFASSFKPQVPEVARAS